MKRVILILAMGLFLNSCGGTYTGNESERRGEIYVGIDKSTFCRNSLKNTCWDAREIAMDQYYSSYDQGHKLYYSKDDYEIISSPDFKFYVFKDVTNTITSKSIWEANAYGNGKLISIHNSMSDAKKSIENDIAAITKKKQQEEKRELTFTINDKKEQCEAIGFTPQTEKFADCVLRLVELDVKSQQQKQIELAISQGNQQVADELRAQRNQQSGEYLMNLSQQLLTPTAPASLPTTRNCSVRGTGVYKRVTCW